MQLRNVRLEVLRREALSNLIGSLALAIFTVVGVVSICYITFVANERTAGLDLEMSLGIICAGALVITSWFLKNAFITWRFIDKIDERTHLRKSLLANTVRPM